MTFKQLEGVYSTVLQFETSGGSQNPAWPLELRVPAMHCEGCLRTITQAVTRLPEVEGVEGDLQEKIVTVHYRGDRTAADKIRHAVDEAGFPVG